MIRHCHTHLNSTHLSALLTRNTVYHNHFFPVRLLCDEHGGQCSVFRIRDVQPQDLRVLQHQPPAGGEHQPYRGDGQARRDATAAAPTQHSVYVLQMIVLISRGFDNTLNKPYKKL